MKDKKYEITHILNYRKQLNYKKKNEYASKYIDLMNNFLLYTIENIHIQNRQYYLFVIKRGLETFSHVFKFLLLYTKNIELTIHHCKKSFFYYIEFIGQIGDDNHTYLQLNSKDATLFCYKKTIFELNNEYRKKFVLNENEKDRFEYINNFSQLTIEIFKEVINNNNYSGETKMSYMMYIQKMTNKILDKLINLNKDIPEKIEIINQYLHYKNVLKNKKGDLDECLFFNLSVLFFKKLQNNKKISKSSINKKMYNNICDSKLENETPLKFTNWLFNGK